MIELENAVVYHGSNLDVLPTLPDNSVDAIVTDPPYELGFMGKSWDSSGIAYSVELWQECLRVLKPGGHLLAFSGSRTYHRMTVAIEDAGFEVRDMIAWVSNKTFPKSHNISKAIDKAAGAEREVVGTQKLSGDAAQTTKEKGGTFASATNSVGVEPIDIELTASATDEAKKWDGWGTALKPTVEPVVMARKPFDGTIANNVLTWGVGGLNIDGSRIGTEERTNQPAGNTDREAWRMNSGNSEPTSVQGRWPANIILDEHTAGLLDEQSGHLHGDGNKKDTGLGTDVGYSASSYQMSYQGRANRSHNDSGGASRFFYVARASKTDRNEGLEDLPEIGSKRYGDRNAGTLPQQTPQSEVLAKNFHPTVKPTALMEYLVKLVTPEGGTVLDPFTGSGSTGKAALLNGFKFIGIELTADYLPIIEGRLKHAAETYANQAKEEETKEQETLF